MINKYFNDEVITQNSLYFICYMIERVARKINQRNRYVVNKIGKDNLYHLISLADILHCENPIEVEDNWIKEYNLFVGDFDITKVDTDLVDNIPTATQIGKVYMKLILDTLQPNENYVDGIIRIYNNHICYVIDNYNCSAYYEPSYVIAIAYNNNGF